MTSLANNNPGKVDSDIRRYLLARILIYLFSQLNSNILIFIYSPSATKVILSSNMTKDVLEKMNTKTPSFDLGMAEEADVGYTRGREACV